MIDKQPTVNHATWKTTFVHNVVVILFGVAIIRAITTHQNWSGWALPIPVEIGWLLVIATGAAKAAAKLFTEGLYSELLGTNVPVTVVFPGAIATNIAANSGAMPPNMEEGKTPAMKAMPAADAAAQFIRGMEEDAFRVVVGSDAWLMDFIDRAVPRQATHFIYNQMRALLK